VVSLGWGVQCDFNTFERIEPQRRSALTRRRRLRRALGDVAAQKLEGGTFQLRRFVLTTAYGGLFNGTVGHLWYIKLDSVARRLAVPGTARFVATKVAGDTVLFGPVHVGAFFSFSTLAEGGNLAAVSAKLQRDLIPSLAAEVTFWPAVQAANFSLVPLKYQLLVVNAFTIVDAAFMSWAQHKDLKRWMYELLAIEV
jgi:protein Mpv17